MCDILAVQYSPAKLFAPESKAMTINIEELERLLAEATRGDWRVIEEIIPHYRGGSHIERSIITAWDHPQLKGPYSILTMSYGLGEKKSSPARALLYIKKENADLLVALRNHADELIAAYKENERNRKLVAHFEEEPNYGACDLKCTDEECASTGCGYRQWRNQLEQLRTEK